MPMSGANMSTTMQGIAAGYGWIGSNLPSFCDAVSNGLINGLLGLPFSTQDTGSTPGVGVGSGVGLTGVITATLSGALLATMTTKLGSAGADLPNLCDAIANAFVAEIGLATLVSNHTPVFLGSGVIVAGSITMLAPVVIAAIQSEGVGYGFLGTSWPGVADAVGTEVSNSMTLATGTVTITGSPTGSPVVPGVGVGSGTLS